MDARSRSNTTYVENNLRSQYGLPVGPGEWAIGPNFQPCGCGMVAPRSEATGRPCSFESSIHFGHTGPASLMPVINGAKGVHPSLCAETDPATDSLLQVDGSAVRTEYRDLCAGNGQAKRLEGGENRGQYGGQDGGVQQPQVAVESE